LEQVDKVIVAFNVRDFVRENRFQMCRAQSKETCRRHKNYGSEPANYGGNLNQNRLGKLDAARKFEAVD